VETVYSYAIDWSLPGGLLPEDHSAFYGGRSLFMDDFFFRKPGNYQTRVFEYMSSNTIGKKNTIWLYVPANGD
jgi:hypothetical protein